MEALSLRIFGTPDYKSVLEILPPYDGLVKQFITEAEKLGKGVKPPEAFGERRRDWSLGHAGD